MGRLSVKVVEESNSGQRRSFRAGGDDSRALVINLLSPQGVVGCLTLQYDDSGRPMVTLRRERAFHCRIHSFAQTKLFNFKEVKEYGE
jgi:hypothetical protein